jgi:hypothetical protein
MSKNFYVSFICIFVYFTEYKKLFFSKWFYWHDMKVMDSFSFWQTFIGHFMREILCVYANAFGLKLNVFFCGVFWMVFRMIECLLKLLTFP